MDILTLLVIASVMLCVQVGIWKMFPRGLRNVLMANPIIATVLNLLGSGVILMFTGVASMVGTANLLASVMFGFYAYTYKRVNGLKGIKIEFLRLFNIIPLIPYITVSYEETKHGNQTII